MFEATMNQMANINNQFQGKAKKVLCVCSAGLLRSPTLANVLHEELGYNTRAVGTATNFALIPLSEALIYWADEIVFTSDDCLVYLSQEAIEELNNCEAKKFILDIPDQYFYNDAGLREECINQYMSANEVKEKF